MPLIHEGNRAFLKDNHQKLEQSEEALENLAASIGIIRVRDLAGCASTFGLGIGVVSVDHETGLNAKALAMKDNPK